MDLTQKQSIEFKESVRSSLNANASQSWLDCEFNASPDDEIEKIITYKPNRGVLFPSNLYHYAMAPHRFFTGMRISLAYKFFLY